MKRVSLLFMAALLGAPATALAGEDEEWTFAATPYLWLPTIEGDLNYDLPPGSGSPDFEVGPVDWFELLNFAALLAGSANKGRYSVYADFVYLNLQSDGEAKLNSIGGPDGRIPIEGSLSREVDTDLTGVQVSLAGGYRVVDSHNAIVDVLLGARYFGMETEVDYSLNASITGPNNEFNFPAKGSLKDDTSSVDVIVGVRGRQGFDDSRWSLEYQLDVGGGDADFTWNAMAVAAYTFDSGDLLIAYRHLEYDQGSDGLVQNFSFSGPAFGYRFRF